MGDVWSEIVQQAELGGVPLPVVSRDLDVSREFARFRYPNRPGQETQDTGRSPYVFRLECAFFADVRDGGIDWYPSRYAELLQLVTDDAIASEPLEYVDPILGPFQVQLGPVVVRESGDQRDGAFVSITLEESLAEESPLFIYSVGRRSTRSDGHALAMDVDDGLAEAGVADEDLDVAFDAAGFPRIGAELDWQSGQFFSSAFGDFLNAIDSAALTFDEVSAKVDAFNARVQQVLSFDAVQTLQSFSLYSSLVRLSDTVKLVGEETVSGNRRVVTLVTGGEIDVWTLALRLYGDSRRASEILELNSIANPLRIPERTTLRVHGA